MGSSQAKELQRRVTSKSQEMDIDRDRPPSAQLRSEGEENWVTEYLQNPEKDGKGRIRLPGSADKKPVFLVEELPEGWDEFLELGSQEVFADDDQDEYGYKCKLESINRFPQYSWEDIYLEDSEGNYIVKTENKKGHEIRNMLFYNEHGVIPDPDEFEYEKADGNMFKEFFDITASQVEHNENVSDSLVFIIGLNSEPAHYHIIASDLEGNGDVEDLDDVNNYIKWDLSGDYSFDEPEEIHFGDVRGELGLKPFYEHIS